MKSLAEFSPTVLHSYAVDRTWWTKNGGGESKYDLDGYDQFGYNVDGNDRAGYRKKQYETGEWILAHDNGTEEWVYRLLLKVTTEWEDIVIHRKEY